MKASRWYIIGILVFMAVMFILESTLPKKFVWNPTFSQYDRQPFGCAIFDDVIQASLPTKSTGVTPAYAVSGETLYQLSQDSLTNYSILVIADKLQLSETDREALLKMLDRGGKIMLVSSRFDHQLKDTLSFDCIYGYFNFTALKKYVSSSQKRDTLYWCEDSVYNDRRVFEFYPHMCQASFNQSDSLYTRLVEKVYPMNSSDTLKVQEYYHLPFAITRKVGKGEITLVSTPLLFTNYGMLDGTNSDYIFRLLNQLKGLPIIRSEAYAVSRTASEETPFRYLLSQRPLRWGLYMTLIVILLFMIFTARRRQRVIPIVRKPDNKTVEFVELIGTLYFQRNDHTDLVQKKFIYFAEKLRRNIQVDIEDGENDGELAHRIAQKTGVSEKGVFRLLVNIRPVIRGERKVDEETMRRLIEDMNIIINHI